jgi:hypothetical protein
MKHSVTCLDFRRIDRNTLCGFCTVRIDEIKLTIHDVALHRKGAARWAQLPARPVVRDGQLVLDDGGKLQYAALLEFPDRAVRDAFSHAVWNAVITQHPELEEEIVA